jgi:hypothetical protein
VKWSAGVAGDSPDTVDTRTSTVPSAAGGAKTFSSVSETSVNAVVVTVPKLTDSTRRRFSPLIVTGVAPAGGPTSGAMAVTTGGGRTTAEIGAR